MSIQLTDVQLRKIKEFIEVLGNEKPNYAGKLSLKSKHVFFSELV